MIDCIIHSLTTSDAEWLKDEDYPKCRRYTTIFFITLMGIGLLVNFIINIIWWSRINPWYLRGETKSKIVYIFVLITWAISIIGFIFFIVYIYCGIFKDKSQGYFCVFNLLIWFNMVVSVISFCIAIQGDKVGNKTIYCSKSLTACYNGAIKWANGDYTKYKKFLDWYQKLNVDNICMNVAKPALIIALIQFGCYIIFQILLNGCGCCEPKPVYNFSTNEDNESKKTEQNSNNEITSPN